MQTEYLPKNIQDGSGSYKKGTCLTCLNDYARCEHRREYEEERKKLNTVLASIPTAKEADLSRLMSRYELESDEFQSITQKAERLYNAGYR